jgi:ABC-type dipeptide/oligopeptide/nickel transport system ATPase component
MTITDPHPQPSTLNPQPAEAVVVVRGLTKVFKDFWGRPKARAVDGVDFEVRKGEVFGLLGPNGSGKSTTVKMLLDLIRADVAEDKIKIDNPTQNLESYFLDVVARARRADAETSGAQSGGRVAAYLRGEAEARPGSEKILERLTLPAAQEPESAPAPAPRPAVNQGRLEALAKPNVPAPTPASPAPAKETGPAVDLTKANEKLSSLLNKPKE